MSNFLSSVLPITLQSLQYDTSFACRYNTKKNKWSIYGINLPKLVLEELKENTIKGLEKKLDEYDPEQESKDNVYKFDSNLLVQQQMILQKFLNKNTSQVTGEAMSFDIVNAEKIPNSSSIDFMIHKFSGEVQGKTEDILVFSKHKKLKILNKVYKIFSNEDFHKVEKENLYIFNTQVTCIYYTGFYYIYNVGEFHEIFKYWEKLKEKRNEVLNFIEQEGLVSNLDDYKKTFEQHYNMKSMVKIDPAFAKEFVQNNKESICQICEENELDLEFNKENQQFTLKSDEGVTTLNRILSKRSGHNLVKEFVTFPTFKKHQKKKVAVES
ncbi:Kiwa anti-phage protein KwaB-like domain-containing protein [Bacillus mobilis]|uniref:Kiwa anti-phage protein KwaB-like domain-containing protein n=1 Tax=Bacillus mobilis TaxID=2026190 RepID=UPI003D07652E